MTHVIAIASADVTSRNGSTGRMILVDPDHQPTMAELMSHTAGFAYGLFGSSLSTSCTATKG